MFWFGNNISNRKFILIHARIRKNFYKKEIFMKEKIFTSLANVLSVTESF